MSHSRSTLLLFVTLLFAPLALPLHLAAQDAPVAVAPQAITVRVTYAEGIDDSFTGRVYLMLGHGRQEPRFGPNWFGPAPYFAKDVTDWNPGETLVFDDTAIAYPGKLSEIAVGNYGVQAVMRRNPDSPTIGQGAGTAYSRAIQRKLDPAQGAAIEVVIDQIVKAQAFKETVRIKLVELRSELLSAFHGRDIIMRAAIVLPRSYGRELERKYPALYWIGGFGSDHHSAGSMAAQWGRSGIDDGIVRVVLDPLCYGGHHVFADSDNNGPRAKALVEEFIPHLEKTFNLVAAPTARFLSGHSSGGWSSLWLQVAYPDFFGGVWSIAPDPVDFRDFQRINLYEPGVNMYRDASGARRPLARFGDQVAIWYEDFCKMEVPYGEGGQLRSFEWVFSPRGPDALPLPLYDRETGAVNAAVAEKWKRYDIRMLIEQSWPELKDRLAGKVHIHMGELDTFYLEGATKLLKDTLEKLGSDAVVEVVPGRDHGSIADSALRRRIDEELIAIFNKNHPDHARPVVDYD